MIDLIVRVFHSWVPLLILTVVVFVRVLIFYLKEIESQFKSLVSRIEAIEKIKDPFRQAPSGVGPTPIIRTFNLRIAFSEEFWAKTLELTPAEIEIVKKAGFVSNKWWAKGLQIRCQEWRGGYTTLNLTLSFSGDDQPKTFEFQGFQLHADLWRFELPERVEQFRPTKLTLEVRNSQVRLYADGGTFNWVNPEDPEPSPHNILLTIPIREGPNAEPYFKPGFRDETYPGVFRALKPFERFYEHDDTEKGLAWEVFIDDFDLAIHSKGDDRAARKILLASWQKQFAWSED